MLHYPAHFQEDVYLSPESRTRKVAACPKKADQINKTGRQTDSRTNKRAKVAKWTESEAAAARVTGRKLKRVSNFDDVLDGGRRDVDKRTRRDLDKSDDE